MAISLTGVGTRLQRTGGALKRTSGVVSLSSDYTAMWKVSVAPWLTGTTASSYRSLFYIGDDPTTLYVDAVWIGIDSASDRRIDAWMEVGASVQTGFSTTALATNTTYHITYTRSGTTHKFYIDGVLELTLTLDMSGVSSTTDVWLGNDGEFTQEGQQTSFKEFREWNVALTSVEIAAEMASTSAVRSSGLQTDTVLTNSSTLTDASGNGHTWSRVGQLGTNGTFGGIFFPNNEVDPNGDRTVAFWFRPDANHAVNDPDNQLPWITQGPGSSYVSMARGAVGVPNDQFFGGALSGSPFTPGASGITPLGKWAYVVYRRSGDNHRWYLQHVQIGTDSVADWAGVHLGHQEFGDNFAGAHNTDFTVAYYREWAAALTPAELLAEAASPTAVRTANLYSDVSFASDYLDATVNGTHWATYTGGISFVADSPFQAVTAGTIASTVLYPPTVANVTTGTIAGTVVFPPAIANESPRVVIEGVLEVVALDSNFQVRVFADDTNNSAVINDVYDAGDFHDIEIRGAVSSWDTLTEDYNFDGWYELVVDGDVIASKYDIQLYSVNGSLHNQLRPRAVWTEVTLFPQGDALDCLRIAPYTVEESPVPVCCNNQGPGGSPTTPPPVGPGIDIPPIVLPPIVIPPDGAEPPAYVACEGGGVPATVSDPVNGASLANAVTPLIKVEWSLADSTIDRLAKLPLAKFGEVPYRERVMSLSPITYALADRRGNIETLSFALGLNDADGTIRERLSTGDNKYIIGRRVQVFIESDENRRSGGVPFRLTSGVITNYPELTEDLLLNLPISDELGYRYSPFSLDRQMPYRTLRPEMFPNLPAQNQGLAVPIIYGEMSDENRVNDPAPYNIPYGIVPTIYLGTRELTPLLGGSPETWDAYLVCGHAIASVQAWFASNLDASNPGSVRMAVETAGAGGDFLIPGYANWDLYFSTSYNDLTDTDLNIERYTIIYAKGAVSDAAVGGTGPITLNVCGIEDIGDGTGTLITDIAYQILHFLAYWVLPDISYRADVWGAIPTYPTAVPKVSTELFAAVNAIQQARLPDGYPGAWMLVQQTATKEILVDLQIGSDIRLGINNHTQIIPFTFDETQDTSALLLITAEKHVQENSFRVVPRADEIENVLPYVYGPEPATGRFTGAKQILESTLSITNYLGERRAQDLAITTTRNADMANDVVLRRLLWSQNTPTYVQFNINLSGLDLRLGQLIRIKHFAGLGLTGWTDRILLVTKLVVNPEETDFNVQVFCEDVHDLMV